VQEAGNVKQGDDGCPWGDGNGYGTIGVLHSAEMSLGNIGKEGKKETFNGAWGGR
jgi:hypothetical protein